MSVNKLGSPHEPVARTADAHDTAAKPAAPADHPTKKTGISPATPPAKTPPSTGATTDKPRAEKPARPVADQAGKPLPDKVSRGVAHGPAMTQLRPEPLSTTPELQSPIERMNAMLLRVQDMIVKYPASPEAANLANPLFDSVWAVLVLKTSGDLRDAAIGKAADELERVCYRDPTLPADKRDRNVLNLRLTTDYVREFVALGSKNIPADHPNTVTWILPHAHELKGGYNVGRSERLDKATKDIGPKNVALLLADLFDRHRYVIDPDLPSEALDTLSRRLAGADSLVNDEILNKAKAFISNYRAHLSGKQ